MGGIRSRLVATLVALVAVTVLGIGLATYAFVDARLRDALLEDATRQAQFNLSVLVPGALPPGATSRDFEATGLPAAFRLRGDVEEIVDFGAGDVFRSTAGLEGVPEMLPAEVRSALARDDLGFAWVALAGAPSLVVAGRAPLESASRPAIYFVFPAGAVESALSQLRLGLGGAALIAVVLALATAGWIARGILRPVRSGSAAAARIAAGDLDARIPTGGADELAAWAVQFNRMADSLAATIKRLEASESQNRRFVADVSHELRTPLTALVAEASLIEAAAPRLPDDVRRPAELLVSDVRRLRTLVEELMELSRFDARAEMAQLAPVDLVAAVRSIVAARLPSATFVAPDEPLVVESDIRRIDRILGNLLDNARVHAPGAPVEVTLAVSPDRSRVSVVVSDRGPGTPPEGLGRLFERFYKADASRRSGSSGIGLAIAAEHAALLGGRVTAEPRSGGGLRFQLDLPVTKPLPRGDALAIEDEQPRGVPGDVAPAESRSGP